MKKPTVATLFAGCGGDSLGFTNGGFELVFANDNNPDACETMKKRFENSSGKKIIHKGNVEKVKDFGIANIITGGFPCQHIQLSHLGFCQAQDRTHHCIGKWETHFPMSYLPTHLHEMHLSSLQV